MSFKLFSKLEWKNDSLLWEERELIYILFYMIKYWERPLCFYWRIFFGPSPFEKMKTNSSLFFFHLSSFLHFWTSMICYGVQRPFFYTDVQQRITLYTMKKRVFIDFSPIMIKTMFGFLIRKKYSSNRNWGVWGKIILEKVKKCKKKFFFPFFRIFNAKKEFLLK